MIITIDGPVASGKSTIAREVAKELDSYYLGTGILYRALAFLLVQECGYSQDAMHAPVKKDIDRLLASDRFVYTYDAVSQERVIFDGKDITPELKNSVIDAMASILSTNGVVRAALTALQRELAQHHNVIIEGRDSGSVVFPQADYKLFLTASASVRAQRWQADQRKKGATFSLSEALQCVQERDKRDKEREMAPLLVPEGAIIVDSSELDKVQTLNKILSIIKF